VKTAQLLNGLLDEARNVSLVAAVSNEDVGGAPFLGI
jgi:hypothetical protein